MENTISSGITVGEKVLDWLLEREEPSVQYHTLVELLELDFDERRVQAAKQELGKRGWSREILDKQKAGVYWESPDTCYLPKWASCVWQLILLADLGMSSEDPRIGRCVDHFFDLHNAESGGFSVRQKGHPRFGAHVCLTGNMVWALAKLGYASDDRVRKAMDWLVQRQLSDGGWNCSMDEGGKHGSFKSIQPLWALSEMIRVSSGSKWRESSKKGCEFLLNHQVYKSDRGGSAVSLDFEIAHYPNHYHYDFLRGLRILTGLGIRGDSRMDAAVKLLLEKQLGDGRWSLEGVYRGWRYSHSVNNDSGVRPEEREVITHGWGDGYTQQIEEAGKPSKWTTLQSLLILKRLGILDSRDLSLRST